MTQLLFTGLNSGFTLDNDRLFWEFWKELRLICDWFSLNSTDSVSYKRLCISFFIDRSTSSYSIMWIFSKLCIFRISASIVRGLSVFERENELLDPKGRNVCMSISSSKKLMFLYWEDLVRLSKFWMKLLSFS